jgi:argininosuccinate lyase
VLLDGLDELARRHEQGTFVLDPAREDVHTNIEMALAELPAGRWRAWLGRGAATPG